MPYYYPQAYSYQPYQYQQPQQTNQQSIIWINGAQAAQDYLVAPNSAVTLWDTTSSTIYLKQADATGRPTLKTYDLVERTNTPVPATFPDMGKFITHDEYDALVARVTALEAPAVKEDKKK